MSKDEEKKFKELCLCPEGPRSWCDANEISGFGGFAGESGRRCRGGQGHHVGIKEKEQVHGAWRDQGIGAAQCREEVRLHCEKCYDDKSETSEKQVERIRAQKCRGDSAVAIQGRRVQITVNRELHARGKMLHGKSNGPADFLVVEMLSRLPTEVIHVVTHRFPKRFQEDCRAPEARRILRLVFLNKPDARLEKELRRFRAIALLKVFSKWYTSLLVDLLHEEKEPIEWLGLHMGAERGVNYKHMQGLLTNLLEKHWE